LPVIGEQLSMPENLQGLLITAYAVMVGIFAVIIGPISDKVGRRRILLVGTASMAVALTLHGLVTSYQQLIVMRALAGIAGGLLSGSAVSYVGDYFPVNRRGWANGWVMSGAATGQIIGIPLGTIMAEFFGFRIPFLMFGASMMLTFYIIYAYVPQPDVRRDSQPLSLSRSLQNYVDLIRRPEIMAATTAFFMMFLSVGLFVVYFPTWMQQTYDVSGTYIASLFLVGGIANVLTGPNAGRLSDRIGRRGLIIISCTGTSLLFLSTTFFIFNVTLAYPFFFLVMMLVAIRVSPFQTLLSESVSDDRRGSLMSLSAALGQTGLGIGGAIAGIAFTQYGYLSNTILAAAAILCTALLVWRFVPESQAFLATKTPVPADVAASADPSIHPQK